jgi:hypothetical protein
VGQDPGLEEVLSLSANAFDTMKDMETRKDHRRRSSEHPLTAPEIGRARLLPSLIGHALAGAMARQEVRLANYDIP